MSTLVGKAYHPINGSTEDIWEGFSWPCLFLSFIWFLYKSMWGWALISLFVSIFTYGLAWFVFPFFSNGLHAKSLLNQGYLTEKQWQKKDQANSQKNNLNTQHWESTSVADEIKKLANLKEQGFLSEEEFVSAKQKLFGKS